MREESAARVCEQVMGEFTYEKRLDLLLERWRNSPAVLSAAREDESLEAENCWQTALSLLAHCSLDKAETHLTRAVELRPENLKFRLAIAVCYFLQGKNEACKSVLLKTPQVRERFEVLVNSLDDKATFRTLLYGLEQNIFDENGRVKYGEVKRV